LPAHGGWPHRATTALWTKIPRWRSSVATGTGSPHRYSAAILGLGKGRDLETASGASRDDDGLPGRGQGIGLPSWPNDCLQLRRPPVPPLLRICGLEFRTLVAITSTVRSSSVGPKSSKALRVTVVEVGDVMPCRLDTSNCSRRHDRGVGPPEGAVARPALSHRQGRPSRRFAAPIAARFGLHVPECGRVVHRRPIVALESSTESPWPISLAKPVRVTPEPSDTMSADYVFK
jgi:hypothetical protein